ncbi:MAG: tRNA (N(6)-L-threonylcarbamoyladenosine(37)-C(2))-methylthiotransferase MtaB [Eubacterium sp.]|nr:tRNA (N(6)-L-threonylcarbamoyladenosine(37)-C(2))-methylthiotransferase MtaB [Eubacterium sp.]
MKVAFLTLGCKVNYYETGKMMDEFEKEGYEIVEFNEIADVYIINTCTVTNIADRKSRQMIHKASKNNPSALVVACGCYADATDGDAPGADISVINRDKNDILKTVNDALKGRVNALSANNVKPVADSRPGERTRSFVKIQDGCNQFCTYCLIPYVRGKGVLKSRPEDEVVEEIREIAGEGCKEVVLTGIHLSSYGTDLAGEKDFLKLGGKPLISLMEKLQDIDELKRIRLSSLEPRIITEEWICELKKLDKVCPHFHLSMQSGCDDTLRRMNRHYTSDEYAEKVSIIRQAYEHPAITTDVIVGFPGETDEEFRKTYEFVKKIGFADLHVFQYSKRSGTFAAKMENQVDSATKKKRSEEMIGLAGKSREAFGTFFRGKEQEILFETECKVDGKTCLTGFNTRYVKFMLEKEKAEKYGAGPGEIVRVPGEDLIF